MGESSRTVSPVDYGLLLLLGILLGTPYALTKISQTTIPPLTGVAARVSLAAFALWIIVLASRTNLSNLKNYIPRLFMQGCISCVVPYALIAYGQTSVDSALAAILNSTTPLFVYLISLLWTRHESLTLGPLVGLSAGMTGIVMIAGASSLSGLGRDNFGQVAIILATVSSAVAAIQGRRLNEIAPQLAAAGTLTCGAIVLVPLCIIVDRPLSYVPSTGSVVALTINALVATALRSVIYFRLIRTIGSMGTTSASYLKPVVGVLIGCTLMSEALTWTAVAGLLAIFFGVVTINRCQFRSPSPLLTWATPRAVGASMGLIGSRKIQP
jgi:drug/metabolite transporter (DMT)-like permease